MSTQKTIAMKVLEGKKVPYEALSYPAGIRDAQEVARSVGMPENQVFKTLVVPRPKPGKPMLVLVPANYQLDLKKLAKAANEKKLKMASHAEAERLTGLQVGGISPLALLNRGFDVFLDESANQFEEIIISAGQRGLQIRCPVPALIEITNARVVEVRL